MTKIVHPQIIYCQIRIGQRSTIFNKPKMDVLHVEEDQNENLTPLKPTELPSSGSKRHVRQVSIRIDSGSKSFKIPSSQDRQQKDDSLARAVNGQANTPSKGEANSACDTPLSETWLKPSSVKRLQQVPDAEKYKALEQENIRLREALKQLKGLMANQSQLVVNSAVIVEGAKKYVMEKTVQTPKVTIQRRNPLSVKVLSWETVEDHVEYTLEVQLGNESGHTITKRYTEFLGLRQKLLTAAEMAARPESCFFFWNSNVDELSALTLQSLRNAVLPKKVWFGNFNENTLSGRSEALQTFLDDVLKACKRAGRGAEVRSIVSDWIGIQKMDEDNVWCDDRIKPLREFDSRARQARVSEAFEHLLNHSPIKKAMSDHIPVGYSPSPLKNNVQTTADQEQDLALL